MLLFPVSFVLSSNEQLCGEIMCWSCILNKIILIILFQKKAWNRRSVDWPWLGYNTRNVVWSFTLGWAILMVLRISRHWRKIILVIKIVDFKEIYILYKFTKISVEAIVKNNETKCIIYLVEKWKNKTNSWLIIH